MVDIYTFSEASLRVRNKNKGKRKRNKKVNFINSIEETSLEHLVQKSNSPREYFLPESSDTLNDDLIRFRKQCLWYPKSMVIGHLSINSMRNTFSTLQQTVLSKTDVFLLSETKIGNSFPGS